MNAKFTQAIENELTRLSTIDADDCVLPDQIEVYLLGAAYDEDLRLNGEKFVAYDAGYCCPCEVTFDHVESIDGRTLVMFSVTYDGSKKYRDVPDHCERGEE